VIGAADWVTYDQALARAKRTGTPGPEMLLRFYILRDYGHEHGWKDRYTDPEGRVELRVMPDDVVLDGDRVWSNTWTDELQRCAGGRHEVLVRREVLKLLPDAVVFAEHSGGLADSDVDDPGLPSKRGAKPKFAWDLITAEVLRYIHEEGIPGSATGFTDKMFKWCKDNIKPVPEFDTLRKRLNIWLSRLPR
jgi:hypothetical protein